MTYLVTTNSGTKTLWYVQRHNTTAILRESELPPSARHLFDVFAAAVVGSES